MASVVVGGHVLHVALSKPFYAPGQEVLGTVTCTHLAATAGGGGLAAISVQLHGHVFAAPPVLKHFLGGPLRTVTEEMRAGSTPKAPPRRDGRGPPPDMTFFSAPRSGVCVLRSQVCSVPVAAEAGGAGAGGADPAPPVAAFHFTCPLPRRHLLPSFRPRSSTRHALNVWYCVTLCALYRDGLGRPEQCCHVPFGVNPSAAHAMARGVHAGPARRRSGGTSAGGGGQRRLRAADCVGLPPVVVACGPLRLRRQRLAPQASGRGIAAPGSSAGGGDGGSGVVWREDLAGWSDFEALQWNNVGLRDYTHDRLHLSAAASMGAAQPRAGHGGRHGGSGGGAGGGGGDEHGRHSDGDEDKRAYAYNIRNSAGPVAALTLISDRAVPGGELEIGVDVGIGGAGRVPARLNCERVRVRLVCVHRYAPGVAGSGRGGSSGGGGGDGNSGRLSSAAAVAAAEDSGEEVTEERCVDEVTVDFRTGLLRTQVCLVVPPGAQSCFRTPLVGVEWRLQFIFTCPVATAVAGAAPPGAGAGGRGGARMGQPPLHGNGGEDDELRLGVAPGGRVFDNDVDDDDEEEAAARVKTMRWQLPVYVHPTFAEATNTLAADSEGGGGGGEGGVAAAVLGSRGGTDATGRWRSGHRAWLSPPPPRRAQGAGGGGGGEQEVVWLARGRHDDGGGVALQAMDTPLSEHVFLQTTSKTTVV